MFTWDQCLHKRTINFFTQEVEKMKLSGEKLSTGVTAYLFQAPTLLIQLLLSSFRRSTFPVSVTLRYVPRGDTDRGTAFHNELIEELLRMSDTEKSRRPNTVGFIVPSRNSVC